MERSEMTYDVILNILLYAGVEDILRCERVNHAFKEAVNTKILWLVNLRRLHYTCTPALPPHKDPGALSCGELRSIVVHALSSYKHAMSGEARYRLRASVKMEDPFGGQGRIFGRKNMNVNSTVQLSPGGRYLFALHSDISDDDQLEVFQAYDLEKGGVCVWALPVRGFINTYSVEGLEDGQIHIAVECVSWINVRAWVSLFELTPSENGLVTTRLYTHKTEGSGSEGILLLSGPFIAFARAYSIRVFKWNENEERRIILIDETGSSRNLFLLTAAIYGRFLFVFESALAGSPINLHVLDLNSVFSSAKVCTSVGESSLCSIESHSNTVGFRLDQLYGRLEGDRSFTITRPGISKISQEAGDERLAITFCAQHSSTKEVTEDFLMFSAIFGPGSVLRPPSLTRQSTVKPQSFGSDGWILDGFASGTMSVNVRSLFFCRAHPNQEEYLETRLLCASRRGTSVFARLLMETESGVMDGQGCEWVPVLDSHSNSLLCRRFETGSGEYYVDIYIPY